MSTVSQITVTDVSQISVVTAGTQGVAGPNTILGRSVADSTASTAGSLLVYDHSNTQWVDSQSSAAQSLNAKLFNLGFTSGGAVVTGVLDEDNMGSNSNTKLATQQSIKSYVDAQNAAQAVSFQGDTGGNQSVTINTEVLNIAGGTGLDTVGSSNTLTINIDSTVATLTGSQTLTNKTLTSPVLNSVDLNGGDISSDTVINKSPLITLAGDLSGSATLSQLGNATLTATIVANSVALGTDTTGNYVATIAAGEGIDVSGSGSETAAVTISAEDATDSNKGIASFDSTDFTVSSGAVTVNAERIQDIVGAMVTSNTESGLSVDYQDADGTIDFNVDDFTIALSGDLSGSVTITDLASATLTATIVNNAVALGTDTTGNYVATLAASNSGIDVANSGSETAGVTVGLNTEFVQDLVGAMLTGNTENGITVTYEDSDGTIDFDVADPVITLSGDVAGSATMTNLGDVTISTTIQANSVALGTDTTGNYIATVAAGEGIDVSGSGSESAAITISAEDATDSNKGIASFDSTDFTVSSGDVTLNAERVQDIVGAMVSSNTESGISVTYEDGDGTIDFDVNDPTLTFTGDVTGSGTITNLGNTSIGLTVAANSVALGTDTTGNYVATIADAGNSRITVANSGSETAAVTLDIADDAIGTDQIANNAVTLGTQSTGNYVATIAGTSNEIEVSGSGSETAAVTIGLPDNVTIGGALTVTGDLTVNGTTTTINTTNLDVEDTTIRFAKNATTLSATNGAGLEFGGSSSKPTILWNNSDGRLVANKIFAATSFVGDVAGNASTATALETARAIALSGDVVGTANFDGTAGISISTTIQANSVALGTDTTGNYIATIAGTSNEVEVSGSGSETAAVTIGLPAATEITTSLGVGGGSTNGVVIEQGAIKIKNGGTQSFIDFYCESNNAHYLRLQAPAHSAFSGNPTVTLPAAAGTLVGTGDSGTVSNTMLANSSINFGGVSLALGASDTTPAFNLQDATGYPTSSLTGTITNAQLAGSIANAKLANSSINFGGVSLALGASDTTPAFDLSDATNYPTSSLSGTITNAQLAGSIANSKLANSTITVSDGSNSTATALGGTITFAAGEGLDVAESSGTVTFSAEDATASNKGIASFTSDFSVSSGAVSIANTGVSAGSYGTATAIPAITVNAKGQITAVSTNNISTSFTLAADSGSNDTFATGETLTISGTSNEIETAVSNNEITIGLPDAVTVTTLNTTNLNIGSAGITEAELEILDGATVTTDELNILDGATVTTAELNLLDGGTSATSTTLATTDRVIVNDAGTMKQVALSDLATFMGDNVTINQTQTALTVSGNGSFGGTLTVTGATTLNGGLTMDTNKFTVADTTGNTSIGGTLGVTGATTLSSTLGVTGAATLSSSLAVTDDVTVNTNVFKVDTSNNRVGIKTASPSVSLDAGSATDAFFVPKGTTAQRPSGAAGHFRYNTTLGRFEGYTDAWGEIGGGGTNTFTVDNFTTANASTTAFTLSQTPNSEDNLFVFIGGVFQNPNDYVLNGTTLTLDEAPPSGTRIIVYSVRAAVSGSNLNNDQFTASGSAAFTLSIAPVSENNTQVFIDGVYQQKSDYSISGSTLTFDTAPATGAIVEVNTFTQTNINVPVDDTITTAKLVDLNVTTAKIAADAITGAKIADNAIDSEHYTDGSIDAAHLNANVISGLTEVTPVSGDKMMILDATDSALKKADVNDIMATAVSITSAADAVAMTFDSNENAAFTGTVTANAGVVVDNITIDGTEIDLSSGDLTVDVAGTISLDADGADIMFKDGGTEFGRVYNSSSDFAIYSAVQDKDIKLQGNDGGSTITALTLDMSEAGRALFNAGVGIKTTAASGVALDIREDSTTTAVDVRNTNASGFGAYFAGGSSSSEYALRAADKDNNALFSVMSDGNIGVGITNPSALVTLVEDNSRSSKTGTAVGQIHINGGTDLSNGDVSGITFSTNTLTQVSSIIGNKITNSGSSLFFGTSNSYASGVTNTALEITPSGNIGVGTDTIHSGTLGPSNRFLEVAGGTAGGSGTIILSRTTNGDNNEVGGLRFVNTDNADDDGLDSDGMLVAAISARSATSDSNASDDSGGLLTFSTKPEAGNFTEAMRINSGGSINMHGNVRVGTALAGNGVLDINGASGTHIIDYINVGGSRRFVVNASSGNVQNTNNAYGQLSDSKIKENIVDATNKLEDLNRVKVKNFNLKGDKQKQIGVIAQELESIFPSMVENHKDYNEEGEDLGTVTKSVKYSVFVPILIKAIQEQQVIINDLKARIETLEG